jgi:tetratricopeptide (TPR) repeat protein
MSHAAQLLQEATGHHQAGRMAEAEKAYHKLLRVEVAHADGLRLLGGLYLQTGEWGKAVEYLEKAALLTPKDAETLTNLGLALRQGGRSEEAIARYKQALEVQPAYAQALNNLGSLYHSSGRLNEALTVYGQVLRQEPDNPIAHYNYANSLFVAGKVTDAMARYEYALKLKPDYLEAMINLGMALSQAGRGDQSKHWLGMARNWFDKALHTDPDNIVALNNMGNVLRQMGDAAQAVDYYRRALRLRPDYAQAAINLATALRDLGCIDEAISNARAALIAAPDSTDARINLGTFLQDQMRHAEAIEQFDAVLAIKPFSIDAQWNKALSLLALGQYEEGWKLHEIGLGVPHMRGDNPSPERRWQGESLKGKRLLVWCEQGLGDSLQFVRYVELCKQRDGTMIVLCPRPLRKLFGHCSFIDALPETVDEKDFDFHVPMMSLPFVFGSTLETIPANIPYLHVGAEKHAAWQEKFNAHDKFRVGLVWAGNPRENQIAAHLTDRRRSMNLEMLRPLFDIPGVAFYNLQMGAGTAQIGSCGLQGQIVDLMGDVKDFEDTGAIIEQLDLVISVDTSVVHLAGGMGRPVWVLSRYDACWRWLQNRPDTPWYPSAQVFGQQNPGDWASVVKAVRAALIEKLSLS